MFHNNSFPAGHFLGTHEKPLVMVDHFLISRKDDWVIKPSPWANGEGDDLTVKKYTIQLRKRLVNHHIKFMKSGMEKPNTTTKIIPKRKSLI